MEHGKDETRLLGELKMIESIATRAPVSVSGLDVGIGDDAAVVDPAGRKIVLSCDCLVEEVHFRWEWSEPISVGRKAAAVNLSDLAAMGAEPAFLLVALALSPSSPVGIFEGIREGLLEVTHEYGAVVIGGDLSASPGPLMVSITAVGWVTSSPLLRSGASPGDRVFVSGTLGDSAAGNLILQKGSAELVRSFPSLVHRHREPVPRVGLGLELSQGLATACIDVSDGLLKDLGHLARQSGCAASVDLSKLPVSEELRACGQELLPSHPVALAASGGEDFELIFTVSPGTEVPSVVGGVPVVEVGKILEGKPGDVLAIDSEGKEVAVASRGWDHF